MKSYLAATFLTLCTLTSCSPVLPTTFLITHLSTSQFAPSSNASISFTITDSATNASTTCNSTYKASSPSTQTAPCFDPNFGWRFYDSSSDSGDVTTNSSSYKDIGHFEIELKHNMFNIENSTRGVPDTYTAITFGNTSIAASNSSTSNGGFMCGQLVNGTGSCSQKANGIIVVNITREIE